MSKKWGVNGNYFWKTRSEQKKRWDGIFFEKFWKWKENGDDGNFFPWILKTEYGGVEKQKEKGNKQHRK